MTLSEFFLSPHGRISRQEYWLGMLSLMAATIAGAGLLDADALSSMSGKAQPPSGEVTVLSLVLAWPSTAVTIKRFSDRNRPRWLGYALGVLMAGFVVANYLGYLLDPDAMSPIEKLITVVAAIGCLWALVENGFQRGTRGPNRYGADPLQSADE